MDPTDDDTLALISDADLDTLAAAEAAWRSHALREAIVAAGIERDERAA